MTIQSFLIQNKNSRDFAGQVKAGSVFSWIPDLPSDLSPPVPVIHLQTSCLSHLSALLGWRSCFLGDGEWGIVPTKDTVSGPFNMKLYTSPGHLGVLLPRDPWAQKGVLSWHTGRDNWPASWANRIAVTYGTTATATAWQRPKSKGHRFLSSEGKHPRQLKMKQKWEKSRTV